MAWRDTVFLSWRVDPAVLPALPGGIEPDLHDGSAWVSVVAFTMHGKRAFGVPLAAHVFPEVNVRTYVRRRGMPGIRFLSMDTSGRLVCAVGRAMGLPYRVARIRFGAEVTDEPQGAVPLGFAWEAGPAVTPSPLERFLAERYVAFMGRRGWPRLHVHHAPWPLHEARARRLEPGFLEPLVGRRPPDHVAASAGVDAAAWLR